MYSQVFNLQSSLHRALGNPKRLEIIHLLRDQELPVSQIVEMLGLAQANISQHLMLLRKLHLVKSHKAGKEIYYRLTHPNLIAASDLIRELLIDLNEVDDHLAQEMRLKMKDLLPVVKDSVCQMRLSPKTAAYATKHHQQTYYFCAQGCLQKFKASPEKFL
jgi:ArsR family transcriptional regulator